VIPDELDELKTLARERPPEALVHDISRRLGAELEPVLPLPSNAVLVVSGIVLFAVIALLSASDVGLAGFRRLDLWQKLVIYPAIIVSVVPLILSVIAARIPGSRAPMPFPFPILIPLIVLTIVTPILFPAFGLSNFVRDGVPCLRLGTICAVVPGFLTGAFLRRGFVTHPARAALTGGALAGAVGVAVLALHCPIQNTPHILVWHLGVIVTAAAIGAFFFRGRYAR
jgi:hypothetical protein